MIARESARRLALLGGSEPDAQYGPRRQFEDKMILVDTSIWVDHIRAHDVILHDVLMAGKVLTHP